MKSKNLHVAATPQGPVSPLRGWGPALAWAALIFGLSSIPGPNLPEVDVPNIDKLAHLLVYVVLGALCLRGLRGTTALRGWRAIVLAALLGTLYGVTDELHQAFTPRRSPDWRDGVADAAGSLLGAAALARFPNAGRRK